MVPRMTSDSWPPLPHFKGHQHLMIHSWLRRVSLYLLRHCWLNYAQRHDTHLGQPWHAERKRVGRKRSGFSVPRRISIDAPFDGDGSDTGASACRHTHTLTETHITRRRGRFFLQGWAPLESPLHLLSLSEILVPPCGLWTQAPRAQTDVLDYCQELQIQSQRQQSNKTCWQSERLPQKML